ncbi:M20 metallopeptidase family protein [Tautonia sociabilis]|uniref:Amidohydrolase n=1 Tax=Tautonia sociabilis TaxID=2080755 RepID=A0A432MQT9_9BACT|nr:amidohydrolase [Tautonia sociabilis]RUL89629.1 amidohydrolase [Tautonia sociabilis]
MVMTFAEAIDACIDEMADLLRSVRRHLHAHPEPSLEEYRTTEELARILGDAGILIRIAPTGRGLIAGPEPEPGSDGPPRVALRADIDALRMQDAKLAVPYRSTCAGVMHACGHDAHTAMALGAALALHRCREHLPRAIPWRAIFQPAEETGDGALEMIRAGAMEGVSAIVALHVDPELGVGRVARRAGVLTADCRDLKVEVRGRGGHAARPHQAIDPIAAAVRFVSAVYQEVPRSVDVREPVVVTFGMFHGGQANNVIPDTVCLEGTLRSLSQAARERACAAIQAIARGVNAATGAEIQVEFLQGVDPVINDPGVMDALSRAAAEVVGPDKVGEIPHPSLGGEDFAAYLRLAPGAMLRLGVAGAAGWPALHSPRFDIDERALVIGAKILARSVVLLSEGGSGHA